MLFDRVRLRPYSLRAFLPMAGALLVIAAGLGLVLPALVASLSSAVLAVAVLGLLLRCWYRDLLRLERRQLQHEQGYRSMFRDSPLPMCVTDDASGGFLVVNDAFCRLYGYAPGELLGMRLSELDDGPLDACARRHLRRDGTPLPVRVTALGVLFGNRPAHLQQIRDLSAQRAAEARLRLYIARMPIACLVLDAEDRVLSLNPAGERIFGVAEGPVAGQLLLETALAPCACQHLRFMLARLHAGSIEGHGITEHLRPDGGELVAEWFITALQDVAGVYDGCVCMVMDVTVALADRSGLAHSHRELAELSARLIDVQEQERRSLARELHDEIGQQLAALRLQLATLKQGGSDTGREARLDDCLGIVASTLHHIRDRAMTLRPAVLDDLGLNPALEWYAALQSRRSAIPVVLDLPPPRRYAEALEITVFRIVQEAVNNAIKHARPGRIEVRLRVHAESLEVCVSDDGCGFDLPRRGTAGPGMGLAGMRERATLAGGHLLVDSRSGGGTRITASLPLVAREALEGVA